MNVEETSQQNEPNNGPVPGPSGPWIPEGLLVVGAVLLSMLIFISAAVGYRWFADRQERVAADTASEQSEQSGDEESEPSTGLDDEVLPCPDGTALEICEVAEFVQQAREKPFKEFPAVELLDGDAFVEALLEDYDEGRQDLEHAELAYKGLGFVEPDFDLFGEFRKVLSVNVVGFYDPETGRLVVKGGELNFYVQSVLVHELVHALDDQWFDLDREFEDDEQRYGFVAVVEGNATVIEESWTAQLSRDEQVQLFADQASAFSDEDLDLLRNLPRAILDLQLSPYEDGAAFLLAAASEQSAVDELLVSPPETAERVLHPETEASSDPQVEVDEPGLDVEPEDSGKLGEVVLRQLFDTEAAQGWDGDTYVVWERDSRACIAVNVALETERDRTELLQSAQRWAGSDPNRRAELVGSGNDSLVSFTNCEGS